ncbi:MAG: GspE/PulE family protein [Alphaproteobacteria bacterium]
MQEKDPTQNKGAKEQGADFKGASEKVTSASRRASYDPDFENFQDFTILDEIPDLKHDDLYSSGPKVQAPAKPEIQKEDWKTANIGGMNFSDNTQADQDAVSQDSKEHAVDLEVLEVTEIDNTDIDSSVAATDEPADSEFDLINNISSHDESVSDASGAQLPVQVKPQPDSNTQGAIVRRHTEIKVKAEEARNAQGDNANAKNRLGDRLVGMGIITEDQLNVALQEKKITGRMIGEVLVDLGFIDEETLTAVLAETSGFEVFDPKHTIVDGEALNLIEKKLATKYQVLPFSMDDQYVYVAMSDPYDVLATDTLRQHIPKGLQIKPVVTTSTVISDAIDAAYGYSSAIADILKELEGGDHQDVTNLKDNEIYSHPIVRLVNALLIDAVKLGVSDLHFEPEEHFVRLRYRLDGVLFTSQILHKQHWNGISQRLKLMAEMNIADKLSPQDGRFGLSAGGKDVDFRVSSLPTVFGENIVLRVLDKSASIMPLDKLGFSPDNLKKIKTSQLKPEGIIIVTGPTGSGKSTSLYSMLNAINSVEINIQTLEDPVEYSLPMIRQTHVREGYLDFADGIKALLRQDPDIIFIGEIRDKTTAEMALKAAMTGHQVYTTLHTNDSFGAIPRLLDLGLKPGMIAGALVAVFAQRLTRCLCTHCKEAYKPSPEECRILSVNSSNPPTIYRAKQGGCEMCAGQGYKGRIAVAEILTFDEDMNELLARGESKAELKIMAEKKGFKNMKDDGILKVLDGITDLQALARVVDIHR